MNKSEPNVHRIGEISAATGMTIRTLHYYEEIGLIPYREYSAVDPETLLAPWPPVRLGRHLPRSPSPRVSSTLRTRTTDVDRSSRPINPSDIQQYADDQPLGNVRRPRTARYRAGVVREKWPI
jgi:hypothetical protein